MGIMDMLRRRNLKASEKGDAALSGNQTDPWGWEPYSDPKNPDTVVSRKGLEIYREMLDDDPQVKAAIAFKKLAVLSTGWQVNPATDEHGECTEPAEGAALFVRHVLEAMDTRFDDTLHDIMDGLVFGFSVNEIVWRRLASGDYAGMIGVARISDKPQKTFDFATDRYGNLLPDGLVQFKDTLQEKRLPVEKFIIWSYRKRAGNWYGVSDLRPAYRYWFSKDVTDRGWNIAMERFAMPIVKGTVEPGMSKAQREELLEILKSLQQKTALVVRKGQEEIEYLERAPGGDGMRTYFTRQRYNDQMIARAVLVPDLIFTEGQTQGSKALGEVHDDAFVWVIEQLQQQIEEVVNHQLVRRLMGKNFDDVPVPSFKFAAFGDERLDALKELFSEMIGAGVLSPDEPFIRERLGMPPQEGSSDAPAAPESEDSAKEEIARSGRLPAEEG